MEWGNNLIVFRWLIVMVYFAIIFLFAQSPASGAAQMSNRLLTMFPFLVDYNLPEIIVTLRKSIHVGGYFLAAILIYRAARITPVLQKRAYLVTTIIATLFAALDEWYQTILPHRSGDFRDVTIDFIGIVLALICVRIFHLVKKQKRKASD